MKEDDRERQGEHMCGRYFINDETAEEIEKLIRLAQGKLHPESAAALRQVAETDIHPADRAPVLLSAEDSMGCGWLRWGFPMPSDRGKGLVFNARCESAAEKPLFRNGIQHRRAVIPAAGFYEWDREKVKYVFRDGCGMPLFLAGCCRQYVDGEHFVSLTTQANGSMRPIHDRMPLILAPDQVRDWLLDSHRTAQLLRRMPPPLERSTEHEQLSFFT